MDVLQQLAGLGGNLSTAIGPGGIKTDNTVHLELNQLFLLVGFSALAFGVAYVGGKYVASQIV